MTQRYLEQFLQDPIPEGPSWLKKMRRTAIDRFSQLGFPKSDWEEWRFTNVRPIVDANFRYVSQTNSGNLSKEEVKRLALNPMEGWGLVFNNGHFSRELSQIDDLPSEVKVMALAQALRESPELIEPYLGNLTEETEQNPFVALNSAFIRDGAFILIPDGVHLSKPLYLIFLSKPDEHATVSYPRNLIVIGRGAECSIVECYLGVEQGAYFSNAVTELFVEAGAVVDHYKIQGESERAFHMAQTAVLQKRDSHYTSHVISLGGGIARNELKTCLEEEGANSTLNGLYFGLGSQLLDHHTFIDHARPHGTSVELYKGILGGKSHGVFSGKILVRAGAEKTQASQINKNLLLSDEAVIDTKPLLEIFNHDVKCNHGATIGRLDPNQVFYLRSRGVDLSHAWDMLTYAFASDLMSSIKITSLKVRLQEWISLRLMKARKQAEVAA